jgi:hypothetical protein
MRNQTFEELPLFDKLLKKVLTYYSSIWQDRRQDGIHEKWLENFKSVNEDIQDSERLNALYLLSKFMYFGNLELRVLLKSIYRDLFRYKIISSVRKANSDTTDINFLNTQFGQELGQTRFLGVGNPSESGVHLLYYFRQENNLTKELFINTHEIFKIVEIIENKGRVDERKILKTELFNPAIRRYIFIDDFCGSGTQAKEYSKNIVSYIKSIDSGIEVNYLMLFGTETGIGVIKKETAFDNVESIFLIDETFKCFSNDSRYFNGDHTEITKDISKAICEKYGHGLLPGYPLGYKDGQLLISLFHNTPDNTLPIFWSEVNKWQPVFKRYNKIY